MMRIVESEINNTIDLLNRKKNAEEKSQIINYESNLSDKAEYTTKSKGINTKLKGLL